MYNVHVVLNIAFIVGNSFLWTTRDPQIESWVHLFQLYLEVMSYKYACIEQLHVHQTWKPHLLHVGQCRDLNAYGFSRSRPTQ